MGCVERRRPGPRHADVPSRRRHCPRHQEPGRFVTGRTVGAERASTPLALSYDFDARSRRRRYRLWMEKLRVSVSMEILRYAAFSTDPAGGNPAGVVLDATGVDDSTMRATAADVGFSETAFVAPLEDGSLGIRYFSPLAEVPFCGHATIATAVAHAQRHGVGTLQLHTKAGLVSVCTSTAEDGSVVAPL